MTRTVWKYELVAQDEQAVVMPMGARLLHVAGQKIEKYEGYGRGIVVAVVPTLWAEADPTHSPVERWIALVGTGNPTPLAAEAIYVGTALCGSFVWHVYDLGLR